MKFFLELTDRDFDPKHKLNPETKYRVRKAARAILKKNKQIALLFASKKNYHKLPGGGVEEGESREEALRRELLEETGCNCEVEEDLGVTVEYRDQYGLINLSYIYVAHVVGEEASTQFTDREVEDGFILKWVKLDEVEELMNKDSPADYSGKFINKRDKEIFNFFLRGY